MAEKVTRTSPGTGSSPALSSTHPLTALRAEVDRLFDGFFPPTFGRSIFDFDPWRGFDPWRDSALVLDPCCDPVFGAGCGRAFGALGDITPRVVVKEYGDHYEIAAELPGLDDKDVEVTVRDGVLGIAGKKRVERKEEDENRQLAERSLGAFTCTFPLPEDADPEAIGAEFVKGVLIVTMPRHGDAAKRERKIEVTGH